MNGDEWLSAKHPMPMLEYVDGQVSPRKLRLFACACCRHPAVWRHLPQPARDLVHLTERFAEGKETLQRVIDAAARTPMGRITGHWHNPVRLSMSNQAQRAAQYLATANAWDAAWGTFQHTQNHLGSGACDLIREIFGDPTLEDPRFDSVGSTVMALAQAMYAELAFDRMPILADALEEGGCTEEDVLDHCRNGASHYLGCWVIDLLIRVDVP
jgi:hypothetical protein